MTTGVIELAFTVSAKDVGNVRVMLGLEQMLRDSPVMTSLCLRIILTVMYIVVLPFDWMAMLLNRDDPVNRGGEGVHWGAQRMITGPEDLMLHRATRTTVYRWPAVRDLRITRKMILLLLSSAHAVPVPRHAFASRTDERRFCDFVRARIAEGAKPPQEITSAGYRYT